MNTIIKTSLIFCIVGSLFSTISCKDYLAVKPDKKLVSPGSSEDLMALMNHVVTMNMGYISALGDIASDDIYITDQNWNSLLTMYEANISPYAWRRVPVAIFNWNTMYGKILQSNVVIDRIGEVSHPTVETKNEILGMAHFFRGISFFDLIQAFAVPYDPQTADEKKGIVLRLTPDVNEVSKRSTLKESYDQIIADLIVAARLLPTKRPLYPTRPYKTAAYAALSRCFMVMRDYDQAGRYADSALMHRDALLDYKTLAKKDYPFERFNEEVIFHSQMDGQLLLAESRLRIDSNLLKLYSANDSRLRLYFKRTADGNYTFIGDYSQDPSSTLFNGITTAEMLLTRAECLVRKGDLSTALLDLDMLRQMRYENVDLNAPLSMDGSELLEEILLERRKELVFRGVRWSDIRRLNQEYPISLQRKIGDKVYMMESEDIKNFAFMIPQLVVERAPIDQN